MPFRFFVVSVHDDNRSAEELNGFLRSHRILSVDKRWVEMALDSYWAFCVDYIDGAASTATPSVSRPQRHRVDYREVLSPTDFALFQKLRDLRKEIAQREAVPVYAVFTNEQLAEMVKLRVRSKNEIETVIGVGDARVEKYGPPFLEIIDRRSDEKHEASPGSV
jgi:superfamily II DNA helicase RecQ